MFEKEKGTESCRDRQAFSDFGFYLEMRGHFQGSRGKWHDLIYVVKRWSWLLCWEWPTEVKSRSRDGIKKQLAFSFSRPFPWLFLWLSMSTWANHHISRGMHVLTYTKRNWFKEIFTFLPALAICEPSIATFL